MCSGKDTTNEETEGDDKSGCVLRKAHIKSSKRYTVISQVHCDFLDW